MRKVLVCCLIVLTLAGCAPVSAPATPTAGASVTLTPAPTATPTPEPTLDPCNVQILEDSAAPITDLMLEFEDTVYVANLTPQSGIGDMILRLQDVRRRLVKVDAPECLQPLQAISVEYMNTSIQYLGLFLSGATNNDIATAIQTSQYMRQQYQLEVARLANGGTPIPTATRADVAIEVTVTNTSQNTVNLRTAPALDAAAGAYLTPGSSLKAVARTEAGDWIQVQMEDGSLLWVYASLITLNTPIEMLPVLEMTPTPGPTLTATPTALATYTLTPTLAATPTLAP